MQLKHCKVVLPFFILLFTAACKKDNSYSYNAEIIGMDGRYCGCCGGFMVVIDGKSPTNGDAFFLISEIPSSYKIDNSTTFPVKVKINFSIDEGKCSNNFIRISKIVNQ